jgi:phospholipase/carboxylesterase
MTDHTGGQIVHYGCALEQAALAVLLLHGRGASAEDILELADEMYDERIAYLAPEARSNTWYPNSFLAPIASNEPWLSSALAWLNSIAEQCEAAGLGRERLIVCGFSQGACLGAEFVARKPARYGALIAFTGGLIGPPNHDLFHHGSLEETPALFSSGDPDPHVPWERVKASAHEFERMGAQVQLLRHPGRPHTILPAEIDAARQIVFSVLNAAVGKN